MQRKRAEPSRWGTRLARLGAVLACLAVGAGMASCVTGRGPGGPERQAGLESRLAGVPQSPETGPTLTRSKLLRALGQQDEALAELATASDLARERLSWSELSALWREIGAIHLEQGRVEQALDAFGKRLESAAALNQTLERASALVDTAYAFVLLEHVGQADEAMTEARVLGGDELMRDATSVERLGYVLAELNESVEVSPEAQSLLERAAEAHRAAGDEVAAARVSVRAAQMAARAGDAAALSRLEPLVQGLGDPEPEALLRRHQAELELESRGYERCASHAEQALALADRRGLGPLGTVARVLAARCESQLGKLDAAIQHAAEAGDAVEQRLRATQGELARQQLGFDAFRIYRLMLSLLADRKGPRMVADAFVTSERARARAHLDAVVRSRVAAYADTLPVPAALEQDRVQAEDRVRRLTQALLRSRKQRDAAKRQGDALWALAEIKETIQRSNPLLARVAPPAPADVGEVRRVLLDDAALLLSYFVAGERVLLLAVDRDQEAMVELPLTADQLDATVRRFRSEHLLQPGSDANAVRAAARKLGDALLGPVADRVAAKRRLLVVPHGRLAYLPFESLATADGKYLVESHDVSYAPSATLAVALAKQPRAEAPRREFVGMGDPVYDWASFARGAPEGKAPQATRGLELWSEAATSEATGGTSLALERLPGTAQELQVIARLFGKDAKLYLRDQASEEQVKKGALGGARIVHVASHGLLAPHYQALALTIRPDASEDGFLMSSEIAELKLDADLVVLSACRTGTPVRLQLAEPVAALGLSLRSAGARNVLLSLWSVDDEATADLMMRFYRPLAAATTKYDQSLAEAKRAMIRDGKFAHPFFWAAFVLQGG